MKSFRIASLLAATAALLAIPASAQAQTTLGQLAPGIAPQPTCRGSAVDLVPILVSSGARYEVPRAGVITSWSTNAAAGQGQQLTFKVVRPFESDYLVRSHNGPVTVAPSTLNTFRTSIPVEAGDVLSVSNTSGSAGPSACAFETPPGSGDRVGQGLGPVADGGRLVIEDTFEDLRLNLQATLLEPPRLTTIATTSGSVAGGTAVVLAGSNLAEVRSVTFGGVPASSFVVDPESQITAITPPSGRLGSAAVTVTTAAGATTAAQTFAYEGCLVPKLKGRTLKAAKRLLRNSGCRPGKVKRRFGITTRNNKVVGQRPKPGTVLAPGAKVRLTVVVRPADV